MTRNNRVKGSKKNERRLDNDLAINSTWQEVTLEGKASQADAHQRSVAVLLVALVYGILFANG